MSEYQAGSDLTKWYVFRHPDGYWVACPPRTDDPLWHTRGGRFTTGADVIAAFAAGGKR